MPSWLSTPRTDSRTSMLLKLTHLVHTNPFSLGLFPLLFLMVVSGLRDRTPTVLDPQQERNSTLKGRTACQRGVARGKGTVRKRRHDFMMPGVLGASSQRLTIQPGTVTAIQNNDLSP